MRGRPAQHPRTTASRALALAVLVAGLLGGCASMPGSAVDPDVAASASAAWAAHGSDDYAFTLTAECGERLLWGTYRVTVTGGTITDVVGLDETAVRIVGEGHDLAEEIPTLSELQARVLDTDADDVAEVSFDPATGYPASVLFDPMPQGTDDEECYVVTDYAPTG
ncbi:DUF6174 domain-containing protein [Cellulomonas chitinilytica]|uniref:DUF6174 domain-containing protein n=1 Tax=Cellulomonas chitinilytica TaxID=398759 RepID=UPI001943F2F7|nr:DUF6174 domain-containing protein [Cellulomonas chitinilytica]